SPVALLQRRECRDAVGHLPEDVVLAADAAAVAHAHEELTADGSRAGAVHGHRAEEVLTDDGIRFQRVSRATRAGACGIAGEGERRLPRARRALGVGTHLVERETIVETPLCEV